MQSYLLLNTPGRPLSECSWWSFSGADDRALRDYLDGLDEFVITNQNGRWASPLIFGLRGEGQKYGSLPERITFERAWTDKGALKLAEMLPEAFSELRDDILARFAPQS